MTTYLTRSIYLGIIVMLLFIGSSVVIHSVAVAQSEHPHLPDRPDPGSLPDKSRTLVEPGWIELYTIPFQPGIWTVVQWLDGAGNWNDVPGWQGTYNYPDHIAWAVEQNNFQKGPFRWAIYQEKNGSLLTVSQSFYLPGKSWQIVRQDVPLPVPTQQILSGQVNEYSNDPWQTYEENYASTWYQYNDSQCSQCHW